MKKCKLIKSLLTFAVFMTIHSPVAAVESALKSTATVTWTDPAEVFYGGGGYTIRATVDQTGWSGTLSAGCLTAPAGIRIYNVTTGTASSKKYIEAKFDVQTAFDNTNPTISFVLSHDATAGYSAISAEHGVAYTACAGGAGAAEEYLMAVDAAHIDNDTWNAGWIYEGTGRMRYGHGSSSVSAGSSNANIGTLSNSMAAGAVTKYYKSSSNHFGFYTEQAITGVRLYTYTTNDDVTVSNVFIGSSAFASGTPSSGAVNYETTYNNDNDALRTGTDNGCGWVEITFDSEVAAGMYGQINLSKNVYIAGMALINASSTGASLTTTLSFATAGTIYKSETALPFSNVATKTILNTNSLGAITYSSSNTSVATVHATTGTVTITGSGETTITATLAASGCYKPATRSYTLSVSEVACSDVAGTVTAEDLGCSGIELTVSGYTDGATIQWYKDGVSMGSSYRAPTCTVTVAGRYYAVTHMDCDRVSNTIRLEDMNVSATKLVDGWYVKNGRMTPDVALVRTEGAENFTVKSGATTIWDELNSTTTGFAGCGFTMGDDGIIYLSGAQADGSAPSGLSEGDETITITASVCGEKKSVDVVLHKQTASDKDALAYVVNGTENGDFTAGISADQTTAVSLYNEMSDHFNVQATNIYATDNEQKIKEYYSQYDIICITDYPNTGTKGVNSKSYVDAMGALIDIRPILSMEAGVSALPNWRSKGISGTPYSPTTRQYNMLLHCKDHEIFAGAELTKIGEGAEAMYRVEMVDNTKADYVTLDATYGGGEHAENSGYEYGSKPALQGFEYTQSMSDLQPIGLIDDGAGNDLQVGLERQHAMNARMMVLGVNSYAMERLTEDGENVIINALKYLMKKNAEDISDCSVYFDDATGDHKWSTPGNWAPNHNAVPQALQEARIYKPCVVDEVVHVADVKIITDGTYNSGTEDASGKLTITPTGTLIVDGKIYAATAPAIYEKRTTAPEDLIVQANASNTGALILDNRDGETQATVEMYSQSYWEEEGDKYIKYWSYVGMPVKDVHIPDYFYGAFTYFYNEKTGWEKRFDDDIMQPFEGIGLSMQAGNKETFRGTMVSTENNDIPLTYTAGYGAGDNLIGNSWTAPIQIANFEASDFGSATATVYIYNTGKADGTVVTATAENDGAATAGQWLGIPINVPGLDGYTGLKVIPAMNAFLVNTEVATTLHLDYDKLVRDGAASNEQINNPMRAPRHTKAQQTIDATMRVRVSGEKTLTDVWMLQDERFSESFDNGWEAYYAPCDDRSAQLYANSTIGTMAFLALPDLDGTVLGFAPSRDGNDYTFTFHYVGADEYYLNDLKLQQSVRIDDNSSYRFTYEDGDTNRFYISRTPLSAPQDPTGVENTPGSEQSAKVLKVMHNGKLYIIRGGRVYGVDGQLVK